MNFSNPAKVAQAVRTSDTTEYKRGKNREKILANANGAPPLAPDVAKKMGIQVNTNWSELAVLLSHARRAYYNVFLRGNRFFRMTLPSCPERDRANYQSLITEFINRPLKASAKFFKLHQYRWTDVVVHGPATVLWDTKDKWCPGFVAREDLRIPTDTETDFCNLEWFAVRKLHTVGGLVNKVWGDDADPHWKKKPVANILKFYKNVNYDSPQSYIDWENSPEKLAELVKQNLGYYESDAVPKIPIWNFYFKDTNNCWYLRAIPDTPAIRGASGDPDKFLYEDPDPCADELSQLLHCQFGDLNFKTPFMFHSVRSLGFELMEPTYWTNLTRCRFLQHVHENFNKWIQINDPANKERAQSMEFSGPVVRIPPGVTFPEHPQIDADMVEKAMAQLKQLMQEASATYTQDIDTGTQKEQTAFETGVKIQQVNAMLSGLMLVAGTLETFFYKEIARRFCIEGSTDKDVQEFQRKCINENGIPRKWLDVAHWDIEVEAPLGAGNPTMEQVEADKAITLSDRANPTAKQEMLHDAFTVLFGAKRAARWMPMEDRPKMTEAKKQAGDDFASLMWGIEVQIQDELNPIEQIDVLLNRLSQVIERIKKTEGVPSSSELSGLISVHNHIFELIQRMPADPSNEQVRRTFSELLGRLMNVIKGFQQQLQQKLQKEAQEKNGDHGKSQALMFGAATKAKIAAQESQQRMAIKQGEFAQEQQRQNLKLAGDVQRANLKTAADIQRSRLRSLEE